MAGSGPEKNSEKKDPFDKRDLFTDTGELKGGYDMGMARAYALEHAKKTQGEYVGKGRGRRLLMWQVESSRFDEDAECWEVVLSCQPEDVQVERPGRWVYHVRPQGGLLPGTPIQQQSLRYTPSTGSPSKASESAAPRRRFPWLPIVGVGATLAIVGIAGAFFLLGQATPAGPTPTPVLAGADGRPPIQMPTPTPPPAATPVPTPGPTSVPAVIPIATATPVPTPTPYPTYTPWPTYTPLPIDTPTPHPTPTLVPTNTPRPLPTATLVPTTPPRPLPTATPAPPPATATPKPAPTPTPMPKPTPMPTQPSQVTWTAANNGLYSGSVYAVALSPAYATDRTLFAGTWDGGVFRSTDGGATWQAVNNGLATTDLLAVALSPAYATDRTLFAGTNGSGVFRSADGGATWQAVNQGLTATDVRAVALSPAYATDRTLYAGTEGGVFRSRDGGATWQAVNNGLANTYVEAVALSSAYATDRTVYAGTSGGGVFRGVVGP